ncbi:MAG TPA: ABC transporter ATP-binding protein [Bacteroidia bacterium]|jgi:putative ABC transport system ATP-binding protein|nr:ABC transporter ATP-binding protein [Bacteroidia bacterium]
MKDKTIIQVKNIWKVYHTGDIEMNALKDVSLEIKEGDFVAIMGASGSGKSTFMNILGCLDYPTRGEYYIDEANALKMDRNELADLRNRKIGFIFQSFNILARTSALENVELPLLYNNRFNAKERRDKARKSLEAVGLGERLNSMPNQLSGGQQQRVAVARALINDPVVIMADEPTGNLDTRTSYEIMEIFQRLNDQGITIVMVTHEPDIAQCALRNVVFRDGQIISNERVQGRKIAQEELKKIPDNRVNSASSENTEPH